MIIRKAPAHRVATRITGQGMTEYIIIVALIAIAAIGVVGLFGGVVKSQFAAMGGALGGSANAGTAQAAAVTNADGAAAQAGGAVTLDAYVQ